jgi:WD40 repeat protein
VARNDGVYVTDGVSTRLAFSPVRWPNAIDLSPDGRYLAVSADRTLWVVDLRTDEVASVLPFERLRSFIPEDLLIWGFGLAHSIVWIPGTTLALITLQVECSEGLCPLDDLRILNMSSGSLTTILRPGEGGRVHLCPDGRTILVATRTSLMLIRRSDLAPHVMLTYEEAITYSGFAYAPELVCLPGSESVVLALAPRDIHSGDPTRIVSVDLAGGATRVLATIDAGWLGTALSPDGRWAVYSGQAVGTNRGTIHLIDLETDSETSLGPVGGHFGILWGPDATHFLLGHDVGTGYVDDVFSLVNGRWEALRVAWGHASWAHWLSPGYFLLNIDDKVYLFDLEGRSAPVAPFQYGEDIDSSP